MFSYFFITIVFWSRQWYHPRDFARMRDLPVIILVLFVLLLFLCLSYSMFI